MPSLMSGKDCHPMTYSEAAYYLAAMIDGEGTVTLPPKSGQSARTVKISNRNEDLIQACAECCDVLGITYSISNQIAQGLAPEPRLMHILRIHGLTNFEKLFNEVPIQEAKKKGRLFELIHSYVARGRAYGVY